MAVLPENYNPKYSVLPPENPLEYFDTVIKNIDFIKWTHCSEELRERGSFADNREHVNKLELRVGSFLYY